MTHAHRTWLLAGAACLAGAAPSAAAEPVNGRIAFTRLVAPATNTGDIWTMNPDGSSQQQEVFHPLYDAQSDWSPDGTRIVFRSRRNDRYEVSILDFRVRDAAGRPTVFDPAVATDGTQSSQPSWFPDTSGIVYRRTNAPGTTRGDIWAMDLDGTNRRELYTAPQDQWYPTLSPDGSKLLFATTDPAGGRSIQVKDMAPGGAVTTLFDHSPRSYDSAPAWSPDGRQIAFESDLDGDMDIFVMNADGANVRQITNNIIWDEGPSWSPDGTRFAFSRGNTASLDIWTMAVDGSDARQLTTYPGPDESPDWGRNPAPAAVGGIVPATLAVSLAGPVSLGTFTPGIARDYTASTTATVISTAGNAALSVSEPGHLANGPYTLPQPLRVELAPASWTGPVANASVAITFRQSIAATDALRTGTYARTLTFRLTTTDP